MLNKTAVLLFILLLPAVSASSSEIDITISNDGLVTESFIININSNESYDSFNFFSSNKPLSVDFEGGYHIQEVSDGFLIVFDKNILPRNQTVEFVILYDDIIERSGGNKIFRSDFASFEETSISLSLPKSASLSGNPSTTPRPINIDSDGEMITLNWDFVNEEPSIVVFYDLPANNSVILAIIIIFIVLLVSFAAVHYSKHRVKKVVEATLTEDEKLIIKELRKGNIKQKDIAKTLEFSKSKMSKVLRKLEEKDLISKEPHFKTYKIKIKKIK